MAWKQKSKDNGNVWRKLGGNLKNQWRHNFKTESRWALQETWIEWEISLGRTLEALTEL